MHELLFSKSTLPCQNSIMFSVLMFHGEMEIGGIEDQAI